MKEENFWLKDSNRQFLLERYMLRKVAKKSNAQTEYFLQVFVWLVYFVSNVVKWQDALKNNNDNNMLEGFFEKFCRWIDIFQTILTDLEIVQISSLYLFWIPSVRKDWIIRSIWNWKYYSSVRLQMGVSQSLSWILDDGIECSECLD